MKNLTNLLKIWLYSPKWWGFIEQIEIFHKLVHERKDEIFRLSEEVNFGNLVFNWKDKRKIGKPFNDFLHTINLYKYKVV